MKKPYVIKKRGLFVEDIADKPFKISRSQIEAFVECPRCFYLNHRKGIRRPSSPPFTINSLVDRLLKREFDVHRANQTPHKIMLDNGFDAVPFQHPMMEEWRNNFKGVSCIHQPTNLRIAGALDDIWQWRKSGQLTVVDYKATAKDGVVTLDEEWKISYKRQMEIYIWLLRQQNLNVSDHGIFLYANGQNADGFDGRVNFSTSLLSYVGNCDWIEPKLVELKECLLHDHAPEAPEDCEFCGYITAAGSTV